MNISKRLAAGLLTGLMVLGLQGCSSMVTSSGMAIWEERSKEDQIADGEIDSGIAERLGAVGNEHLSDLDVDVYEGRVMLTGTVEAPGYIQEAASLVQADGRIKAFYNHVQQVSAEVLERRRQAKEKGETTVIEEQSVTDSWIELKIKTSLMTTQDVASSNYRWRSVLNHVYLIGRARSKAEQALLLATIGVIDGVTGVTHHVEIKPGKEGAEKPRPQQPPKDPFGL
jgi:osmotically-inducible protein OsmY